MWDYFLTQRGEEGDPEKKKKHYPATQRKQPSNKSKDNENLFSIQSSAGLQELLMVCSQYGSDFDIDYNAKRVPVIGRSKEDSQVPFPDRSLQLTSLPTTCPMIWTFTHLCCVYDDKYSH